jgi:hypothetical protein
MSVRYAHCALLPPLRGSVGEGSNSEAVHRRPPPPTPESELRSSRPRRGEGSGCALPMHNGCGCWQSKRNSNSVEIA